MFLEIWLEVIEETITRANRRVEPSGIKRRDLTKCFPQQSSFLHHLPNHAQIKTNSLNINMSNVHNNHIDTSELESFEEFEAEGRRYQNDVDLAALMNSFGLANDNNAQSGPGGQVAVVEAVYEEQQDGEHEGRADEPRSSGMRRSADTFDGNEDQVIFAGLVSTTPLVIDLDDDSEDEKEDEQDVNTLETHGNNDHAQEGDDLAEVFESVNDDEGDAEAAAAAIVQLAYEIFDAPGKFLDCSSSSNTYSPCRFR